MEEKRSIKKMAFLLMIIANIVLLIAVIVSVAGAFKNIEPGKVTTGQVDSQEEFTDEDIELPTDEEFREDEPELPTDEEFREDEPESPTDKEPETEENEEATQEDAEESEEANIMDKIKSIIGNFDVYKLLEIGLFAIGIFLFLLGVFLLRAVKRLN